MMPFKVSVLVLYLAYHFYTELHNLKMKLLASKLKSENMSEVKHFSNKKKLLFILLPPKVK